MTCRHTLCRSLPAFLAVLVLALGASQLFADASGRTGKAQNANGCNCHGTTHSTGVTVSITGPQTVQPSSSNSYTLTVTGGPATSFGGFNLKATGGTLAAGANSRLSAGELTHNTDGVRSWTFNWTAPATTGTQSFYAIGLGSDASGDEGGDQWNWYGNAVNTPFAISVSSQTGVDLTPAFTWLAPVAPNPLAGRGRVTYSLARGTSASLEVFDASGRRCATLESGTFAAGPRAVEWAGRDDAGRSLPNGIYFLRLVTPEVTLSRRVVLSR